MSLLKWKTLILCETHDLWEYILCYSPNFYRFQRMFENNESVTLNNESVTLNIEFSFQIWVNGQQSKLLTKVTKELKNDMDSMKQQNNGADHRRSNVRRAVQNDRTDFYKFVDDNANMGGDDYEFASMGQGNRFGPNRARRNVSFGYGWVFGQRENSRDFKHRDDSIEELGTIKLKIPYF